MQDNDSPWKEVIDNHLFPVLSLLAPDIAADIDPAREVGAMEQEKRKLLPAQTGVVKRSVDKLLKYHTRGDDERYLIVEPQAYKDDDFEDRITDSVLLVRTGIGLPPEVLAILLDDDPKWRPGRHVEGIRLTQLTLEFGSVKILDWFGREAELLADPNPFAVFMLAQLASMRTRKDPAARAQRKLALIRDLHARKLDANEYPTWYRYLDWLLSLPPEIEKTVWDEIAREERERNPKMSYVTWAERNARSEGLAAGEIKGRVEGKIEQQRRAVLRLLGQPRLGGAVPDDLRDLVEGQADLDTLDAWFDLALTAESHDAFRTAVVAG